MPSLSELREFRASFDNVGGQKTDLRAKGVPFDELELPDYEAQSSSALTPLRPVPSDFDDDPEEAPVEPEEAAPQAPSSPADHLDALDFGAFLGAPPDDLPVPPVDDMDFPGGDAPSSRDDAGGESPDSDDFNFPPDLLSDFPGELDATLPDENELAPADDGGSGFDNFGDVDLPGEPAADSGDNFDLDNLDGFDLPGETASEGGDNFDLDGLGDMGLSGEPAADGGDNFDLDGLGDMGFPSEPAADGGDNFNLDDLGGLDLPGEPSGDGGDNFDLDGLGDMGFPGEPAAEGDDNFNLDNLDDTGFSDEPAAEDGDNFNLDDLGGLDLPGEVSPEDGGDNFDLDGLGGFDLPGESAADESPVEPPGDSQDLGILEELELPESNDPLDAGFELPGEADTGGEDEFPADAFENFDPGSTAGQAREAEAADELSLGDDEFSFPGLDNILQESPKGAKAAAGAGARGKARGGRTADEKPPEVVEEIQLSDTELEYLLETLAGYPLNLRIACEEIIAEQNVTPEQMSRLIRNLIQGVPAREAAAYAGQLLGRSIPIPRGFEKSSGAALEAERLTFGYIFVHNFLPVLRLFVLIAIAAASLFYLIFKFVYIPLKAESIYKIGYERIFAGEYQRANERFTEAFTIHRKKDWFFRYAQAFRDERQYIYAEQKYDELLKYYPRDKQGVLDYSVLETYYLRNYAKADNLLNRQLLDYAPNDPEGLLAAGDNCLEWGEVDASRYEDARYYYARLLDLYGWTPPVVERMMKYFIRTDNLKEVLPLREWFDANPKKRPLSAETLAELGGYLLDKQLEEARGVPNEYVGQIEGVRDLLLRAIEADPSLPEGHYHLARYYHKLGSAHEERVTLELAIRAFDNAREESIRRLKYRIDAHQRLADVLIDVREFFPAEEHLVKGINLYEDAVSRRLISRSPQYGRLYAGLGDLEYFVKTGDMEAALRFYHRSEQNGWAPPEMKYRMGSAYYQLEDWKNALEYLFAASSGLPLNRRVLFALGNAALKRGDYFAAQGYYNRLLDILEAQRARLPVLLPNDRPDYLELAERLLMARNNAGVACEMLAAQTGNRSYQTSALAFYAEANRAWDARTRDPRSMIRSGSAPLPFLNSRNALHPQTDYEPQIFIRIDRDALEPSIWEELASFSP